MKLVEKRCTKCGVVRKYRPRIRHCREQKFGKGSYWCYGLLEAVATAPATKTVEPKRPQDAARRKLAQTERAITALNDEVFKLAKRLGKLATKARQLSVKASRYAAASSMTDEEVEQLRQRRLEQQRKREASKRTRAIDLEE